MNNYLLRYLILTSVQCTIVWFTSYNFPLIYSIQRYRLIVNCKEMMHLSIWVTVRILHFEIKLKQFQYIIYLY